MPKAKSKTDKVDVEVKEELKVEETTQRKKIQHLMDVTGKPED